jgi:hypothetical protein
MGDTSDCNSWWGTCAAGSSDLQTQNNHKETHANQSIQKKQEDFNNKKNVNQHESVVYPKSYKNSAPAVSSGLYS